jgi:hypothetical protein
LDCVYALPPVVALVLLLLLLVVLVPSSVKLVELYATTGDSVGGGDGLGGGGGLRGGGGGRGSGLGPPSFKMTMPNTVKTTISTSKATQRSV